MTIAHVAYFDGGDGRWERMASAVLSSLAEHCPDWDVRLSVLEPREAEASRASFLHNTIKLAEWVRQVEALEDGEQLLLLDADTLVRRNLDDAFAEDFDIALTRKMKRTQSCPINAGVVFVRGSEASRAFFREWQAVNDRFYVDPAEHSPWEVRFGGINQAALGYLIENERLPATRWLDCAEWNACYEPLWRAAYDVSRIIHYKSHLRKALFSKNRLVRKRYKRLLAAWTEHDHA